MHNLLIFTVVAVLLYAVWIFNRCVGLARRADAAWSDIDALLARRHNLLPQTEAVLKGYAHHEKTLLTEIAALRSSLSSEKRTAEETLPIEQQISSTLNTFIARIEAYPDLKASTGFLEFQRTLVLLETDLAQARRYYNAVIRDYNTLIGTFPPSLIAQLTGHHPRSYFDLPDIETVTPPISLSSS